MQAKRNQDNWSAAEGHDVYDAKREKPFFLLMYAKSHHRTHTCSHPHRAVKLVTLKQPIDPFQPVPVPSDAQSYVPTSDQSTKVWRLSAVDGSNQYQTWTSPKDWKDMRGPSHSWNEIWHTKGSKVSLLYIKTSCTWRFPGAFWVMLGASV
jgi:hypothetical protein